MSAGENMPVLLPRSCPPLGDGEGKGLRVLVLLSRAGHSCQEALLPVANLREAGAEVTLASLGSAPIRFDATCNAIAWIEQRWSRAWTLLREARAAGTLEQRESLLELEERGELDAWARSFDMVVVPGGHGLVLDRFLRDSLVLRAVEAVHASGGVVGLQCHATLVAALVRSNGKSLAEGRHMVCWPRGPEALLGALPGIADTFMPFGRPVQDLLADAGARLHTDGGPFRGPQAAIDGRLVTSRGPWSTDAFSCALLSAAATAKNAKTPETRKTSHVAI